MNKIIALTMISTLSLKAADVTLYLPQEEKEEGPYKPNLKIDLNLIDVPKENDTEITIKNINGTEFSWPK